MAPSHVLVFTACGRQVRVPRELAMRSELLRTQLEWDCDDEEEIPELVAPGVSRFALFASLGGLSIHSLDARQLGEVLDAAMKLGMTTDLLNKFRKAFKRALANCSCSCCRQKGGLDVPEASCAMIDCWDHGRSSYWLVDILEDNSIVSDFCCSAVHGGRLDMLVQCLRLCKELKLICNTRSQRWFEIFDTRSLISEDLREWAWHLLSFGLSVKNIMVFTRGFDLHSAFQQTWDGLSGSASVSSKSLDDLAPRTRNLPFFLGLGLWPRTRGWLEDCGMEIVSVPAKPRTRSQPVADSAMKLLEKVVRINLPKPLPPAILDTVNPTYRNPWDCGFLRFGEQFSCRERDSLHVDCGLPRLYRSVRYGARMHDPEPYHVEEPSSPPTWVVQVFYLSQHSVQFVNNDKEVARNRRCHFEEVSRRQAAAANAAKRQSQRHVQQVPRKVQQPRGHTANNGRYPRGGQRVSRAKGRR